MTRHILFACFLSCVVLFARAQDTTVIYFDQHALLDKSYGFMPVCKVTGDSIYYFGTGYKINLPSETEGKELAFATDYFAGWENSKIPDATAFLIVNYKSGHPGFYIDYNHNLDFSDDGEPVYFTDSSIVANLYSSKNNSAIFPVQITPLRLKDNESKGIVDYFIKHPMLAKNEVLPAQYWMSTKRMNYRFSYTKMDGDSIFLGLYDYDCNGFYNDTENDRILVGDYINNYISSNISEGAYKLTSDMLFPLGDKFYKITEIDPVGNHIKIIPTEESFYILKTGMDIPDLEVKTLDSLTSTLHKHLQTDKYKLIYIWGTWCQGCHLLYPLLKEIAETHADKMDVLGINYMDKRKSALDYINKKEIIWENIIGDQILMDELRVDSYPFLILLDKNNTIVKMNLKLKDIENYF